MQNPNAIIMCIQGKYCYMYLSKYYNLDHKHTTKPYMCMYFVLCSLRDGVFEVQIVP